MLGNKNKKRGISLIVLVITIIVMLILVTATVVSVNDSINKGKLSAFAEDISKIQDAVELYYIQNGEFPVMEGSSEMTKQNVLDLSGSANSSDLQEEMTLKGDITTDENLGSYYKIDLSKIGVKTTNRGTGKKPEDIYVVSYPSMNVYYVSGIKVNKIKYFTITSKLAKVVSIPQDSNEDTSQTTIQTVSGITVKKATKLWTNKMGISIQANLESGELIYLAISGGEKKQITTTIGNNVFSFDSFDDVINNKANIKIPSLTVADNTNFLALSQDKKYIEIIKEKSGTETARIKVDLSNYETIVPVIDGAVTVTSKEKYNLVSFNTKDTLSGVKEVRYDYLSKYADDGTIQNYYKDITTIDDSYLKTNGKLGSISKSGHVELKVPKNVQKIQIAVIDKAGNISKTLDNKPNIEIISTGLYVGIVPVESNKTSIKFNLVINSANGINTANTYVSSDGINFLSEQVFNINSTATTNITSVSYADITGVTDTIYIKAIATDKNSKTETNIVAIDWKDNFVVGNDPSNPGGDNPGDTGDNFTDSNGDKAFIPIGFTVSTDASENTVENGLVIKDSKGNEFVWIPVEYTDDADFAIKFARRDGYAFDVAQGALSKTNEPYPSAGKDELDEYNAMVASVKKYHGFYIARYEASNDGSNNAQSKPNVLPWSDIRWANSMTDLGGGLVEKARGMYPVKSATESGSPVSTLIYGIQWDTAIAFIDNYGIKDTRYKVNGTGKGNYSGALIKTGSNKSYSFNNIYDMAGNLAEWTMEASTTANCRMNRGGFFTDNSYGCPASYRYNMGYNFTTDRFGFRVAMYIK